MRRAGAAPAPAETPSESHRDDHLRRRRRAGRAPPRTASSTPADAAAVDALPAGQRAAGRAARPERRQPVPARHRRGHRRPAPRQRDLPRRRDRVAPARRVPPRRRRLHASPTSAASTAPTSTATGSTRSRCRAATRCRSASTGWSSSPSHAGAGTDGAAVVGLRQSAASRARLSIGEVLDAAARRTSPTSPSPRSGSSRPRGWSSRSARRRATASSPTTTSSGCATCCRCSATTTCRCKVIRSTSTPSTAASSRRPLEPVGPHGAARGAGRPTGCPAAGVVRRRRDRAAALPRRAARRPPRSTTTLLDQLEQFGLVAPAPGHRPLRRRRAGRSRTTARELAAFGLEPRHLRAFRTAADREVGLVEQVVAPHAPRPRRRRRGPRRGGRHARSPRCPCGCTRPWSRPGCARR